MKTKDRGKASSVTVKKEKREKKIAKRGGCDQLDWNLRSTPEIKGGDAQIRISVPRKGGKTVTKKKKQPKKRKTQARRKMIKKRVVVVAVVVGTGKREPRANQT